MKITFCGAAMRVTGSCYYIEAAKRKFLIDCGMFQGKDEKLNTEPFIFNPCDLDFIILTHAHIDHSGKLPLLIKEGFKGEIYCTYSTADLIDIMLRDSGHIQELEASSRNVKRLRKGLDPIKPLYTALDAQVVKNYIRSVPYNQETIIDSNIRFNLKNAGHILGSAIIELYVRENGEEKKITFSGDLGNVDIPIIKNPEYIDDTDYLVMESTYGNRLHEAKRECCDFYDIILKTIERGGNVIIPTFAVGRAQEILYLFNYYIDIEKRKRLKDINFYLDSPLAKEATEVFMKHREDYDEEALNVLRKDKDILHFNNLHMVESVEESKWLNKNRGNVILSSSGMCEAGRIKHHLKHNIWDKKCSIVFVGYQAEGTLGNRILNGAKRIKIYGEEIVVKAEIYNINYLSGHADLNGILNYVKNIKRGVKEKIILTHGNEEAILNLKDELKGVTSTETLTPSLNETYTL